MSSGPSTRHLRGGLVGILAGVLSVAAHGAAGGAPSSSAELTLILLVAALAGGAADTIAIRRGRLAVLGLLAGGQLVGHFALSGLAGHSHQQSTSVLPTGWMLVAHAVATLVCALLIVLAEHLYTVASAAVTAMITRPSPRTVARRPQPFGPDAPFAIFSPQGAAGPRAPPMGA